MPEITLDRRYNNATIRISGVAHLNFKTDRYAGLQTWFTADRWCIEIYLSKGGPIRTEYDSREKWLAVLGLIERAIED